MKIIAVGDSTVSKFNDNYYYPRYGYATMLDKYFNNVSVLNLALSGRSSKSYILEPDYQIFKDSLEEGDYVIIGFGHNDEKEDDNIRFTNASLDINDNRSFKYSLYNNYIKIALEKKCNVILCTPIVRLAKDNKYVNNQIHITKNGDYSKCIIDLAKELDLFYIDLTSKTKELYEELGYDKALYNHAIVMGKKDKFNNVIPDITSVDKTHLNIFGASVVSYFIASSIKDSNLELKNYLKDNIEYPNIDNVLIKNSNYVLKDYIIPDLLNYKPTPNFIVDDEWYSTAFGCLEARIDSCDSPYFVKKENDKYYVGVKGLYGKINFSYEGYSFMFKRIDSTDNFTISATIRVVEEGDTKQAGFGLMLRDDCYINQETLVETNIGHYVSAGMLTVDGQTHIIYSRDCAGEIDRGKNTFDGFYKKDTTINVSLTRLGQRISVKLVYDKEYSKDYYDFDLQAIDLDNMYLGFFASRGTIIEIDNIDFKITSKAIQA